MCTQLWGDLIYNIQVWCLQFVIENRNMFCVCVCVCVCVWCVCVCVCMCVWCVCGVCVCVCVVCVCLKFIPLCYIILQLTYALLWTTTNFISLASTCYTFQSYWPSSGMRYIIFKTGKKLHIYIYTYIYIYVICEVSQTVQVKTGLAVCSCQTHGKHHHWTTPKTVNWFEKFIIYQKNENIKSADKLFHKCKSINSKHQT